MHRRHSAMLPVVFLCLLVASPALAQAPEDGEGSVDAPQPAAPRDPPEDDPQEGVPTPPVEPAQGTRPANERPAAQPPTERPAPTSAKPAQGETKPASKAGHRPPTGFAFGSYGRVGAATDARGQTGRQLNLATHGPRLGEGPYVETDLYYRLRPFGDVQLNTVLTLAFTEQLFHFSGDFDSMIALRNLYLEGVDLGIRGLALWVGSRMYRGDDIYLLDFWPLDNLNTLGGGVSYRHRRLLVAWHIGVNRLKDLYQYQEAPVPGLNNTSETVVLLDRQRMITSLKAEHQFGGQDGRLGAKVKLYAEIHAIGSGTLNAHLPEMEQEELPADFGYLLGLQAGLWNFGPRSHVNLFLRWATGLAAYGEFAIPFGLDTDKRAKNARELLVALSGNYELQRWFAIQVGGYLRYFRDADANKYDWDDGWEFVGVLRPHVFFTRLLGLAMEFSYQGRMPAGLNPYTHTKQNPGITKLSVLPLLTFGKGTYARPQFRLIYTLTHQNQAARLSWNPMDPRRDITIGHYLGIQAEWWFNSTYR